MIFINLEFWCLNFIILGLFFKMSQIYTMHHVYIQPHTLPLASTPNNSLISFPASCILFLNNPLSLVSVVCIFSGARVSHPLEYGRPTNSHFPQERHSFSQKPPTAFISIDRGGTSQLFTSLNLVVYPQLLGIYICNSNKLRILNCFLIFSYSVFCHT